MQDTVSTFECVRWVTLESLHTPWVMCRLYHLYRPTRIHWTGSVLPCKSQTYALHCPLTWDWNGKIWQWQTVLESETLISYNENYSIVQSLVTFSEVIAAVRVSKLFISNTVADWSHAEFLILKTSFFQRRCQTMSSVLKRLLLGDRHSWYGRNVTFSPTVAAPRCHISTINLCIIQFEAV